MLQQANLTALRRKRLTERDVAEMFSAEPMNRRPKHRTADNLPSFVLALFWAKRLRIAGVDGIEASRQSPVWRVWFPKGLVAAAEQANF
jgi:hypothetical protein